MAQLTWREVQAPQLSTRDLALAGQTMISGFDRLGRVLADREDSLRKKATDQAVAAAYMAQDPAGIAQLRAQGLDGLDQRVDRLAYAQALGTAENQLLERTKVREEVADLQAFAQMGDEQAHYVTLLGQGRRDEASAFAAQMATENPDMWGRVAYGTAKDGESIFDNFDTRRMTGLRDAETVRANKADEASAAADRALRAREISARERERAELDQGYAMGQTFARDYRLEDLDSARAKLPDDERFSRLTPTQQRGVLESFDSTHAALTAETSGTRRGLPNTAARELQLQAEGNAAENRARDPALRGLRAAANYQDITMESLIGDLDARRGWQSTRGSSQGVINKVLSDATVTLDDGRVVRPDLSDIRGAIDAHGYGETVGKQIPVWNEYTLWDENRKLTDRVRQIVQQRAQGYSANEEVDIAAARAPIEATAAEITKTRAALNRYVRAAERGQLTISQMSEQAALEKRLSELLETRAR